MQLPDLNVLFGRATQMVSSYESNPGPKESPTNSNIKDDTKDNKKD